MKLYKFRSNPDFIKEELRDEYLYFAEASELNDPIEGFIKLYWKGDLILWKNLLKHYLYTLANTIVQIAINGKIEKNELPIFFDESHFPSTQYKLLFEEIRNVFFKEEDIKDLLVYLGKIQHKIFEKELISYLKFVHFTALECIINKFEEKKIINWNFPISNKNHGFFKQFVNLIPQIENTQKELLPFIFQAVHSVTTNINFEMKKDFKDKDNYENKTLLLIDFVDIYVQRLQNIAFYSPCVTCFMESYKSPAVWGYYAKSHEGICLIFDDDQEESSEIHFDLLGKGIGIHTATQKVKYRKKFKEVDFFRMIGTISLHGLENYWLSDWEGNYSKYSQINKNILTDEWHKKYIKSMMESYTTKLPAWKHEKEHRIVLEKEFLSIDSGDINSKKFNYNFNILKGIIFGVKTPESTKIEIIDLIQNKCEKTKRTNFKFYQAEYDEFKGEISISELKF
jgi:hypothetical protein